MDLRRIETIGYGLVFVGALVAQWSITCTPSFSQGCIFLPPYPPITLDNPSNPYLLIGAAIGLAGMILYFAVGEWEYAKTQRDVD